MRGSVLLGTIAGMIGFVSVAPLALGAPISPDDPAILGNLRLWLKADAGVENVFSDDNDGSNDVAATDGQTVAGWLDFSGGARHPLQTTEAKKPTYVVAGGKSYVRFNGATTFLERAGFTDANNVLPTTGTQETMFYVIRPTSPINADSVLFGEFGASASRYAHGMFMAANGLLYWHGTTPSPSSGFGGDSGNTVVPGDLSIVSFDKANRNHHWLLFNNCGVLENIVTNGVDHSGTSGLSQFDIGMRGTNLSGFYRGDIAEIIVYNVRLDSNTLGGVNEYLRNKYGVAGTLVCSCIPAVTVQPLIPNGTTTVTVSGISNTAEKINVYADGNLVGSVDGASPNTFPSINVPVTALSCNQMIVAKQSIRNLQTNALVEGCNTNPAIKVCDCTAIDAVTPATIIPEGAISVAVRGVLPIATAVNVYRNGTLAGTATGNAPNTDYVVNVSVPRLAKGDVITAKQVIGPTEGCKTGASSTVVGECNRVLIAETGFNDAVGINSSAAALLPYEWNKNLFFSASYGMDEPGWTAVWGSLSGDDVRIVNNAVAEGDQSLRVRGLGVEGRFYREFTPQTSGVVTGSVMLNTEAIDANTIPVSTFALQGPSANAALADAGILIVKSDGSVVASAGDGSGGTTEIPFKPAGTIPANTWHRFDINANLGTQTFTISVDGGTPSPAMPYSAAADKGTVTAVQRFFLGHDVISTYSYYDRIVITNSTGCNCPFADVDGDGDVDQLDFGTAQACITGSEPDAPLAAECGCFDRPEGVTAPDGDIDANDINAFIKCVTGPNIPWSFDLEPLCIP